MHMLGKFRRHWRPTARLTGAGGLLLALLALPLMAPVARAAGDLNVVVASVDGEDMDPMLFKSAGQNTYYPLIFDTFIAKDPQTGELTPGLAMSWSTDDNGKTWVIKLREGVKFHDGSDFTSADAKFSLERYIGRFGPVSAPQSERLGKLITSIDTPDDHTIVIHSDQGTATIPYDLALEAGSASQYIVPKAYIEKVDNDEFNKHPIGTGPFKFVNQELGREMTFAKNDDYWGEVPTIDSLTIKIVPELSARLAQLRSGEADIVASIVGPAIPEVKNDPNLKLQAAKKGHIIYMIIGGMDNPDSPLSNPKVRQAISMAIDRQAIVDHLLYGDGAPAVFFSFPFSVGWPKDADNYPAVYDPDQAKKLLANAGYGSGFTLKFYAATAGRDFAQAIAQFLGQVGIKVDLQIREIAQVLAEMRSDESKQQTRIALVFGPTGSGARIDVGGILFNYLGGDTAYSQPYKNPELRRKVAEQSSIADPEKRADMIADILKTIYEENYIIPLYYADSLFATSRRVKEWRPIPGWGYPSNFASVRLAQ